MSNPGIMKLAKNDHKGKIKRFVIEDNIGESIHLHVDNMRLDFTIADFLGFSQTIRESLEALDMLKGYRLEMFDEHFLSECSSFLVNLYKIKVDEVSLKELKVIKHIDYNSKFRATELISIEEADAFKYLNEKTNDFLKYNQFNYQTIDNKRRLEGLLESIKTKGYPYLDQYIVLFDDINIIRDGQHRASILAYLYGIEHTIKVLRFYFTGDEHTYKRSQHPYYELCEKVDNLQHTRLVLYGYGLLGKVLHTKYKDKIDYVIDNNKYDDNTVLSFEIFCQKINRNEKYCFLISVLNLEAVASIKKELYEKYGDISVICVKGAD